MDDPIFRVDFENINSVPDLHYTLKHMEKDIEKKYNRSLLGRLLHRNDPITPAVTEKKPGLRIKLIIKEEAKSWIINLGIVDTPIVEETDDFRGYTLRHLIFHPNEITVHRHRLHDVNVVRQQVLDKLKHVKDVIQSHSSSGSNSHEI